MAAHNHGDKTTGSKDGDTENRADVMPRPYGDATVHPVELLRAAGHSAADRSIAYRIGGALRADIDTVIEYSKSGSASRPSSSDSTLAKQARSTAEKSSPSKLSKRLASMYALSKIAGRGKHSKDAFQTDGTATGLRDGEFAVPRQRLVMRGLLRGIPNPPDGQGEIAVAQVDGRVWIRLSDCRIFNNPGNDTLYAYLSPAFSAAEVGGNLHDCAMLHFDDTGDGSMPSVLSLEVMLPLDTATHPRSGFGVAQRDESENRQSERTSGPTQDLLDSSASGSEAKAEFVPFIQVSKFNSFILARPSYQAMSGKRVDAAVFALAPLSQETIADLDADSHSRARIAAAKNQLAAMEEGLGGPGNAFNDQQPESIRGKSFVQLHQVATDVMAALGKNPRHGDLIFDEFKSALQGLEVKFNDSQAWAWFIEGDLDGSGRIEVEELQFILYVLSLLTPRRRALAKDAFFMFAKEDWMQRKDTGNPHGRGPSTQTKSRRKKPGILDLVGVLEAIRSLGVVAKQSVIERAFAIEDPLSSLQLDYPRFRRMYARVVNAKVELQKLGVSPKEIPSDAATRRNLLVERLSLDEAIQDAELQEAVERAQVEQSKHRLRSAAQARKSHGIRAEETKQERRRQALLDRKFRTEAESELKAARDLREKEDTLREQLANATKAQRNEAALTKLAMQREAESQEKQIAIRKGLDRINLSNRGLAGMPSALWTMQEAIDALQYVQVVDVSNNQIRRLPQKCIFDRMDQLVKLDASANLLRGDLPVDLFYCRGLKILNLRGNQLDSIPEDIGHLTNLVLLDLANNRLSSLPDGIGHLSSLRALRLSDNHLGSLPDAIGTCSQLAELDATNNDLSHLPSTLGCSTMVGLVKLWVSWNKLSKLPSRLGRCLNLTDLRAANNSLVSLPGSLGRCWRLQTLDVSSNKIRSIPATIGQMVSLRSLLLDNNKLDSLPESIGGCSSLLRLSARHNNIRALPRSLGKLLDLQTLDMDYNEIQMLSAEIAALQRLVHLRVSHNRLGSDKHVAPLPISIGSLDELKFVDLSHNQIRTLPDQIAEMQSLQHLNLSHNGLERLDSILCHCDRLIELLVGSNAITAIDGAVGAMPQLKTLDASCNRIERIPDALGESLSLRNLNLYNNRLRSIPITFALLANRLETFDCARNPLSDLPGKWSSRDITGGGALGERLSRKSSALPYLIQLKQQIDDDRIRRHQLASSADRDRLDAERRAMEQEDHRIAELAARGKFPSLVKWSRRKRSTAAGRSLTTRPEVVASTASMVKEGTSIESVHQTTADLGIVEWFHRHAPEAVEDTWAVKALLLPASEEADEARSLRSAQTARSRSRPGTAQCAVTPVHAMYGKGNEACFGSAGVPAVKAGEQEVSMVPRESDSGALSYSAANGGDRSGHLNRVRLGTLAPVTRAHIRAASAIRTDAFTVMKRRMPAPAAGVPVHAFGVGMDVQVADFNAGPGKSGPPALAAEDEFAPKEIPPAAALTPDQNVRPVLDFDDSSFAKETGTAFTGRGLPPLKLGGSGNARDQASTKQPYKGSKASWPQSDLQSSRAALHHATVDAGDHDRQYTKEKHHNVQSYQNGYSVGEVLDFSMLRAAFFHHACDEWAATGGSHMDGQSNIREFVDNVRRRCQHTHPGTSLRDVSRPAWDPKMGPLVGEFYHEVKQTGVPPQYGDLSERECKTRALLVECGKRVCSVHREAVLAAVRSQRAGGNSVYDFDRSRLPELIRMQDRRAARLRLVKEHNDTQHTRREMNGALTMQQDRSVLMYRKKKALELRTIRLIQREVRSRLREKAAEDAHKKQEELLKRALGAIDDQPDGPDGLETPPESVGGEYDLDCEVDSDQRSS